MLKFKNTRFSIVLLLIVAIVSCTGDYEDINTDPNNPTTVPSTNIMAYVLNNFTANTFSLSAIGAGTLGYSNQVGKIQYAEESIYEFRESTFNSYFATVYRNQQNLKQIIMQSEEAGDVNMIAAATTYSAYIWLIATDMWRDIPFTDALGAEDDVLSPAYETQEVIYPAIMDMLEEANSLFNQEAGDALGSGDLLFSGDTELWQKFANSLRLRMACRLMDADAATAKSVIEQITGNPSTYPVIASNDENAYFYWSGADPYYEPFYTNKEVDDRDDHGLSDVLVDQLIAFNDPRLPVYAKPALSDGEYRGVIVGLKSEKVVLSEISRMGARFRDDAAGFSPYMNFAEVNFIVAEAAARGYNVGTTAEDAYEAGITASLEENGVVTADIDAYLAQDEIAYGDDMDQIYIQKWISLFKNGQEAWAETRRTDVPLLAAAPDAFYIGHSRPPFRQPYPTNEYNLNTDNIAPFWDQVEDRMWGKKMYWDVRTGVN
nr:SusD/RagB family nutrient-binding outer membrane lipoprotein [uncultured Draconibacterium sp.]